MSLDNPIADFSLNIPKPSKPMSAIQLLVKFLDKVHEAVGEYNKDSNGDINCMFFQDPSMKDIINFYPDRICLDFAFKQFETDLFTLTFICEDSNGRNFIVAVGFLLKNDEESLQWLFNAFKKHNPNWRKNKLLFVDFEIKPRKVLRDSFPQPLIIISSYHAIKSFEEDINNMEMDTFQKDNKAAAIVLFKKLVLSSNQSDFELVVQNFLLFPEPYLSYFVETWLHRQSEWRIPLDYSHENIFLNLNLFLEHYNDTLVSLFANESSYIAFIKKLFLFISLKKKERYSPFADHVYFLYSRFSPEFQICKALTPYAAQFVVQQLDLSSEIHSDVHSLSDIYTFDFFGMSVQASNTACSCSFFMLTMLPCRHIFAARKINYQIIFDQSLIEYAWNMDYYKHSLTCMQDYLTRNTGCRIPQDFKPRKVLASHLLEVTVQNLLEVPKDVFQERLSVLKRLANAWENDDDVSLQFAGIENRKEENEKNEPVPSMDQSPCIPDINEPSCSSKPDPPSSVSNMCTEEDKESEKPRSSPAPVRHLRRLGLSDFCTTILNEELINIAYIICVICFTKESCVKWMRSKELIPTSKECPQCKSEMVSRTVLRLSDGVVWLCPKTGESKKGCGKRCSVRIGTWFEQINMTLEQLLIFTYMWVNKYSRKQIVGEINITSSLFVACDKFHRRVCEETLKNDDQKTSSPSSKNLLDNWLLKHKNEDKFLTFLKEARRVHEEDAMKSAMVEDKK